MALFAYRNQINFSGLVLTALAVFGSALISPAARADGTAVTITFDDFHLRQGQSLDFNNPYEGLTWTNFGVYTPPATTPSGYLNGVVSGSNIVADKNGSPGVHSLAHFFHAQLI